MKTLTQAQLPKAKKFPMTSEERGKAAQKAMSKALLEEHRRWNMPFITWKNGKIVEVMP